MRYDGTNLHVNALDWLATALVIVGAINWGLVGIGYFLDMNLNLVDLLLGSVPAVENAVYLLVGLAGLYELYFAYKLHDARQQVGTPTA